MTQEARGREVGWLAARAGEVTAPVGLVGVGEERGLAVARVDGVDDVGDAGVLLGDPGVVEAFDLGGGVEPVGGIGEGVVVVVGGDVATLEGGGGLAAAQDLVVAVDAFADGQACGGAGLAPGAAVLEDDAAPVEADQADSVGHGWLLLMGG